MGTIVDKLNYLNNTKSKLKNEINKIGGNIANETTFRDYVSNMKSIYDKLPKIEGSGIDITLNDTEEALLSLTPEGYASQETTTGAQLFDKDNARIIKMYIAQQSDYVATKTTLQNRSFIIPCQPNTTYTISKEIVTSEFRAATVNEYIPDPTSTEKHYDCYNKVLNNGGTSITITTDSLSQYLVVNYANLNNETESVSLDKMMVNLGTEATEYEAYTRGQPSPNPDYPQPIKVVTGEQNIEIRGKNLFDLTKYTNTLDNYTTIISPNEYTCNAVSTWKGRVIVPISNFRNNTEYTFSYTSSSGRAYLNEIRGIKDGVKTIIYDGAYYQYVQKIMINTSDYDEIVVDMYARGNGGTATQVTISNLQFEEGSQATEYEPYYTPQTYPLSLGNIELARINDYKNFIFKNEIGSKYYNADLELDSWYEYNGIYIYVINGNESWVKEYGENLFNIPKFFDKHKFIVGFGLSNYYKYNSIQSGINNGTINGDFVLQFSGGHYNLFLKNTSFDNVTNFKTDLQEKYNNGNPVIIMFPLKTPTYKKITDTTLISQLENINNNARSYKGTTIIECSSVSEENETLQVSTVALKDLDLLATEESTETLTTNSISNISTNEVTTLNSIEEIESEE